MDYAGIIISKARRSSVPIVNAKVTGKKAKGGRVPKELIYEMRHGRPIYYRDYGKVLSGEKTLEEVMGSSKIQWIIVSLIIRFLINNLPPERYEVATNLERKK